MFFEHFLKCLIAFPIPLKFLLWDSTIFVYFSWRSLSVKLLWCQEFAGRKGTLLFLHIQLYNHQKDLNPVCD